MRMMMLLNDFYEITTMHNDAQTWRFDIALNPSHPIYEGHFPQQPVVPGVCTVQIIKECAEYILQKNVCITQISSCKFLTLVNPLQDKKIGIHLTLAENASGDISLSADGVFQSAVFIKLKANLAIG